MLNSKELLFVVDENNKPLEPKRRDFVHESGLWHRTAHVWIINSEGKLLCQKRSFFKDSKPGLWEARFGGHLAPRADYLDTAVGEVKEELGLDIDRANLEPLLVFKSLPDREFQSEYSFVWNGDISSLRREEDEVEEFEWEKIGVVLRLIQLKDPNWVNSGCELEILNKLEQDAHKRRPAINL